MGHAPALARRLLGGLAAVSLVLAGGPAAEGGASLPSSPAPPSSADRVDPVVLAEVAREGSADFWVYFEDRPDLAPAAAIEDWDVRGQWVYEALTSTARTSQSPVRADLDAAGVDYQAFHITNAILVNDGDAALVSSLATEPGVAYLYPDPELTPPSPEQLVPTSTFAPAALPWGITDIHADQAWAQGVTGEGMVVASIDTGVQWDHPALVHQYRGSGTETVNHNYNWYDVAGQSPDFPADTNGHGTHTTGTIVGDDGGANQIGVAPQARWIAVNGCCRSIAGLIMSGEWTLAPRDLNNANPDVTRRPHIINNSWGTTGPSTSPFLDDVSEAWEASGQFAVFSNGNEGSACRTSTAPGSRIINYSVGNYDSSHTLSPGSSRGAGQAGAIKPDISAPGTAVRSAYPTDGYAEGTGTSMAAPHVAGAVALLWSAAPSLVGDVGVTRALLDGTAIDTDGAECGGSLGNNNMFGEGRLDVLALLEAGPDVVRLSGTSRYATAAAVSEAAYPEGTDTVYLATGSDYPDALVGAALAGSRGAPVLLTRADTLPIATRTELSRLAPSQVYLFGGEGAVSDAVGEAVGILTGATVTRLSGDHRFATAAVIAEEFTAADVVYLATGQNYPDALAGAARAGALDGPVLLTQPGLLPQATRAQLERLTPEHIVVLGGTGAVSEQVVEQLGAYGSVTRTSGTNRYETAVAVSADYAEADTVFVTTGLDWPDALAGAARAGAVHAPVLLVRQEDIPNVTWSELGRLEPQTVYVLGGTAAVSSGVQNRLRLLP